MWPEKAIGGENLMEKSKLRILGLAALLMALCASSALASVSMTLTGVQGSYVMGGVYTSPYHISVDGAPMLLICDDFTFDIPSIPYSWTATTTNLSSLPIVNGTGVPRFQSGDELYNYSVAAVLAAQLMSLPSYNTATAGELSYAIWGIFDPVLITNNPGAGSIGHLTQDELCAITNTAAGCGAKPAGFLDLAKAVVDANKAANGGVINTAALPQLVIYTPLVPPGPNSQEFLGIRMIEPSVVAFLGSDLLGLAGLAMFIRRRRSAATK
jgi:hypothetical protein